MFMYKILVPYVYNFTYLNWRDIAHQLKYLSGKLKIVSLISCTKYIHIFMIFINRDSLSSQHLGTEHVYIRVNCSNIFLKDLYIVIKIDALGRVYAFIYSHLPYLLLNFKSVHSILYIFSYS